MTVRIVAVAGPLNLHTEADIVRLTLHTRKVDHHTGIASGCLDAAIDALLADLVALIRCRHSDIATLRTTAKPAAFAADPDGPAERRRV